MDKQPEAPYGFVQWKGTEVCMDVHCECGEFTHIDSDFAYFVRCCACGRVYECQPYIKLTLQPDGFDDDQIKDTRCD